MKERLTGAVILVALIVLLVPELLSGPGVTAQPTRVTDEDGAPMRSYTIDLADDGGAPRPTTSGEATTELQPAPVQDDAASAESGEAAQVQPDETPVASAQEETPAAPPVETQSAPIAESTPAPVEEIPPAPVTEPPAAAGPPVTGWMIQVGSFASRENAARLARDLKAKGFAASVSESRSGGRSLYRVRVGPEADRAAAQAVLARLRARGHSGAAVVPYP